MMSRFDYGCVTGRQLRLGMILVVLMSTVTWRSSDGTARAGQEPLFPEQTQEVTVPLQRAEHLLLVRVHMGATDCGLFVIDTGSTHTVIHDAVAKPLGLSVLASGKASTVGGEQEMDVCAVPQMSVAGVTVGDSIVAVMDISALREEFHAEEINGLLGNSFLERMPFRIDLKEDRLTLYKPSTWSPPSQASEYRMRMQSSLPTVAVTIDDELSGWFTVDTGAVEAIDMSTGFSRAYKDLLDRRKWRPLLSLGIGGSKAVREFDAKRVEFLGSTAERVAVAYSVEEAGASVGRGAGNIGMKLLDTGASLTFDYAIERVWVSTPASTRPSAWTSEEYPVNQADVAGVTPLMRAAQMGDSEIVRRFIERKADVAAVDHRGRSALHYAARADKADIAALLLEAKADVESATTGEEQRPLHYAAASGASDIVHLLVKHGAQIDAMDVFGRTPLIISAERGDEVAVDWLLRAGAKVDIVSPGSRTALMAASVRGHAEVVGSLLNAGADPLWVDQDRGGIPVLYAAALGGSPEVAQLLIEKGANVDAVTENGESAVFAAAYAGEADVLRVLLDAGADVQKRDKRGLRALDYATARGHTQCISLLYFHPSGNPTR